MEEMPECPLCGGPMERRWYEHRVRTLPYCEKCECWYWVQCNFPVEDLKEDIECEST